MKAKTSGLTLSRAESMLLYLLRLSIGVPPVQDLNEVQTLSEKEWEECHNLSRKQGVMALASDGLEKLPEQAKPPLPFSLAWGAEVLRYEERYRRYCKTVSDLSAFYKPHGVEFVQLKGVGLSSCYPAPNHREGGDIDIYTFSSDKTQMSDGNANTLADKLMEERGITVDRKHSKKHSMFLYEGVMVENHKYFLNVPDIPYAAKFEEFLHEALSPQEVSLEGGEYKVMIPSWEFDSVFVAFHALQHYGSGLALHHLCDWACLKKQAGTLPLSRISDKDNNGRFTRFVAALDYLAFSLFGVGEEKEDSSDGLSVKVLSEILHPLYGASVPTTSKAGIIYYKTKRLLHRIGIRSEVVGESQTKAILHSITGHLREPETIFKTQ